MKPLIIYAAPASSIHCKAILKEVTAQLKDYNLIDLYKIKYDPVLQEDEHYTSGNTKISKQNKDFQKLIQNTEKFVFIYPMWWTNMPAILKGFLDRVFVSGFAYKYSKIGLTKLLKGKAAIIITTGQSKWVYFFYRWPLKPLSTTLWFCGIKPKVFMYGKARHEPRLEEIKKLVKKGLSFI